MKKVNLKAITLLTNYNCTSQCKMCCFHCRPQSTGYMTLFQAKKIIYSVEKYSIKSVSILGGESFLNLKSLLLIIKYAKERGKSVMVFTNGFWASSLSGAEKIISQLDEIGLDELRVSADGFHQEFVPFKSIVNIIKATQGKKLRLIIENTYFLNPRYKKFNLTEEQTKLITPYLNSGPTRDVGRASDSLLPLLPNKNKKNKCKMVDWYGKLDEVRAVNIDYLGFVTVCDGICIGNVNNSSLEQVLDSYTRQPHLIIDTLLSKGPLGIFQLAQKNGFKKSLDETKSDCNLCYQSRQFLAKLYPNLLAPINCYQENYEID